LTASEVVSATVFGVSRSYCFGIETGWSRLHRRFLGARRLDLRGWAKARCGRI